MLNLKKGLALVLAAATAFTFAPVANLGQVADAQAAETSTSLIKGINKTNVTLYPSETVTFTIAKNEEAGITDNSVKYDVVSGNKDVATLTAKDKDNNVISPSENGTKLTNVPAESTVTITAVKAGTTTITVTDHRDFPEVSLKTESIKITVSDISAKIETNPAKITATRQNINGAGKNEFTYAGKSTEKSDTPVPEPTLHVFPRVHVTANDADGFDIVATSTNDKVAKITANAEQKSKLTTGTTTLAEDAQAGADDLTLNNVDVQLLDVGSADIIFNVYKVKSGKRVELVASTTVPVTVSEGIDVLSVKYDSNRSGKDNTNYSVATSWYDNTNESITGTATDTTETVRSASQATYTEGDAHVAYKNSGDYTFYKGSFDTDSHTWKSVWELNSKSGGYGDTIYLDTTNNKTAKINAVDSSKRPVIFQSDSNIVTVDQNGNIKVADNAFDANNTSAQAKYANITITVPKQGSGNNSKATLTFVVPVTVYDKQAVSSIVYKEGQTILTQVVGQGNTWLKSNQKYDDLPEVVLSTDDKKSTTITVTSDAGAVYTTGVAYKKNTDGDYFRTPYELSDKVSYDNATGTISLLKDATKGDAVIALKSYANGTNAQTATVYIRVTITDKKANGKITATPSELNLTAANKTAKITATSNYNYVLSYDLTAASGSDTAVTSSDVSVNKYTGDVTYSGNNSGTVYVRISGQATTTALAPASTWVPVHYSATKNAQTITVDPASVNLKAGETAQINAKSVVSGAALTYKSSDETVATVDATGKVTAVAAGNATITVSAPATDTFAAGTATVAVKVTSTAPAKVTGLKVKNAKGAKVSVTWDSQDKNVQYRVYKKVGNGKWIAKNVTKGKASLSVKKGAKVQVKVKSFVKDADGTTVWGPKAAKKTLKTDKK